MIDAKGIRADPGKRAAIRDLERPTNVSEIRTFMGMVNQRGKYSRNIAEISQPLRELLSSKRSWLWEHLREQAFTHLKEALTRPTVLELYDPRRNIKISAEASTHGIGSVTPGNKQRRHVETSCICLSFNDRH